MRTAVSWSRSWFLLLLAMVVGGYFLVETYPVPTSYGPMIAGDASNAAKPVAPIAAAFAAWHARQLRSYLSDGRSSRNRVHAVSRVLWPILAVAVTAYVALTVALAAASGHSIVVLLGVSALSVTGLAALTIAAHVILGAACGYWLPLPVGAALIGLASYLWLTWPPGLNVTWPRQLTGLAVGCCGIDRVPHTAAQFAALVTATLWILGALVLLSRPWRTQVSAALASVLVITVGFGSGAVVARSSSASDLYTLARERPDVTLCQGASPVVCLWPEHADALPGVQASASAAYRQWQVLEMPMPERISEFEPADDPDSVGFRYSASAEPGQVVLNLADIILGAEGVNPQRCIGGTGEYARTLQRYETIRTWLALQAGLGGEDLARLNVTEESLGEATTQAALPQTDQRSWFTQSAQGLADCNI
ncbi:MAG: hypothetical protein H7Y15_15175 [Pseudonocardia sp.]|nr:hypothetical protein [Pseudonocardia sp.]